MNNFISTFEELNKLYADQTSDSKVRKLSEKYDEEAPLGRHELYPETRMPKSKDDAPAWWKEKGGTESSWANRHKQKDPFDSLGEAMEDEEIEIVDDEAVEEVPIDEEPVEDELVEDEPRQVIIECSKCGALVIKDEADVVVDEESDLVNVEDECEYCEEANGYSIVGVVAPYEPEDADVFEEAFGRSTSIRTQQAWEDEITDLTLALEDETDEKKKAKINKRIKQLEDKFAKQREREARNNNDSTNEGLLDLNVPVNVKADGNTVTVGGIS